MQTEKLQEQASELQLQNQMLQEQTAALQIQHQTEYERLQQVTARRSAVSQQVRAATRDLQELQGYMTEAQQRRATAIEQASRDREQRPLSRNRDTYDDWEQEH